MPHVSKRKLSPQTQKLLIDALNDLFSNLSKSEAKNVISALLTKTERIMLAKRIGASLLIKEGSTEAQISEALKLSIATVYKFDLIIKAGEKPTWAFILKKLERWYDFTALKEALKATGTEALKKFSKGMAGRI